MKIVKISPKGQFAIPKEYRDEITVQHYIFEVEGKNIILKPIKIQVLTDTKSKKKKNELKDFGMLAEKSFNFWNNKKDDIYQDFYK